MHHCCNSGRIWVPDWGVGGVIDGKSLVARCRTDVLLPALHCNHWDCYDATVAVHAHMAYVRYPGRCKERLAHLPAASTP